jgi:hypothetical protein
MKKALGVELHDGAFSTTIDVWKMLTGSYDGKLDQVIELVKGCRQLLTCQYDYTSPLHLAVREGRIEVVRYLVDEGAVDPTYKTHPFLDSLTTVAQDRDHNEIVQLLNDAKLTRAWGDTGKIDYEKSELKRRLEHEISDGQYPDVERMLNDHPLLALDEFAFWGEGIMSVPANNGDLKMLELLMRFGARVPDVSKWGARYYFKHFEVARFLMEQGMNPNHRNWREFTLLHDMAHTGDVEKAALLIDHGADIDAIDAEFSSTPLGYAARWGHGDVVKLLLERGADPDKAGAEWAKPIRWANKKGHASIEADLRRAGAA